MKPVLLLATMETKSEEVGYLHNRLETFGVPVEIIDVSLGSSGENWSTPKKLNQMQEVAGQVSSSLNKNLLERACVVVGLGGGTGGEIILQILRDLPFDFPKILITTLPFDPREAVSDNSIILIPTLTDIEGLNSSLRNVLNNTANMLAGLVTNDGSHNETSKSIGLTTLGITQDSSRKITCLLRKAGHETTSFHANGYGGAAFTRFAKAGSFYGVIDMTIHEITRIQVAGAHVDMPDRFTATGDLPRIVLPGGLNLIGLGEIDLVPVKYLDRPHYQHSGYFTHVKMSPEEMELACHALSVALNQSTGYTSVIIPMGGFSSEDCLGGIIEDKELRNIAADCLQQKAKAYEVIKIDSHINDDDTAALAVNSLLSSL